MTLCLWAWWPVEAEEVQRTGRGEEVVRVGEMEREGVKGMVGETGPEGELTADEIIERAVERNQGETMYSEVTMTIVRPTWTRISHSADSTVLLPRSRPYRTFRSRPRKARP